LKKHPHHSIGDHDHDLSEHPHQTGSSISDNYPKMQYLKKKLHISEEQFYALYRIPNIDHCNRLTFHHNDPYPEWEVNEIIVEFTGTEVDDGSNHVPETGTYKWFNHAWILEQDQEVI